MGGEGIGRREAVSSAPSPPDWPARASLCDPQGARPATDISEEQDSKPPASPRLSGVTDGGVPYEACLELARGPGGGDAGCGLARAF